MSWHFLQGQEAASWEGNSLDGAPSALLKLISTAEVFCSQGNAMDCSKSSRSGTMFEHSTDRNGEGKSMSFRAASPVKTLAQPEDQTGGESKASVADCGERWRGSFAKYSRDSRSWKTAQHSLFGGYTEFSETWPRWGSMRNGECWERITSEEFINGKESGFWPTPTKSPRDASCTMGTALKWDGKVTQDSLSFAVCRAEMKDGRHLPTGQMNPEFVEWLMGWPIGWSDFKPLGMDRFREWQQLHSRY